MKTESQIRQVITDFLIHLGLDFESIECEKIDEYNYRVNIIAESASFLIGSRGEHLQSMQKITKAIFHNQLGEEYSVILDIDNYRKRQEENVLLIAQQKARDVSSNRRQEALPPMSPFFRRAVHLYIQKEFPTLTTESMGHGNYRQVIIKPR